MPVYGLKALKGWRYNHKTKRMIPPSPRVNEDIPEDTNKIYTIYVQGGKLKIEYEENE